MYGRGYREIEEDDAETADEPGKVLDHVGGVQLSHQDGQAVRQVAQHRQDEHQDGQAVCRLTLVLQTQTSCWLV